MLSAHRSLKTSGSEPGKSAKMIKLSRNPKTNQVNYWQFIEEFPTDCQERYPSIFNEAFEDPVGTPAQRLQAMYEGLEALPLLNETVQSAGAAIAAERLEEIAGLPNAAV